MPAIVTHDFFGRDVYDRLYQTIGGTADEAQAFLLGNQGPDPLFYTLVSPWLKNHQRLGNTMHHEKPSQLLKAFWAAVASLPAGEHSVGRAYALGFLCHYTLDCAEHPLVYAQQYAICDAGVEGLTRAQGSEVHAVIESEWDEVVLFTKLGVTVSEFNTSKQILQGSNRMLGIVSKMYAQVVRSVYGEEIPQGMFSTAVQDFRLVQSLFYSPTGTKREIVGNIERLVRPYSFYQSMSHRAVEATSCSFDNHNNDPWVNPYTGAVSKKSFWDIFYSALAKAEKNIAAFDTNNFSLEDARAITGGLNFSGQPVEDGLSERAGQDGLDVQDAQAGQGVQDGPTASDALGTQDGPAASDAPGAQTGQITNDAQGAQSAPDEQ